MKSVERQNLRGHLELVIDYFSANPATGGGLPQSKVKLLMPLHVGRRKPFFASADFLHAFCLNDMKK